MSLLWGFLAPPCAASLEASWGLPRLFWALPWASLGSLGTLFGRSCAFDPLGASFWFQNVSFGLPWAPLLAPGLPKCPPGRHFGLCLTIVGHSFVTFFSALGTMRCLRVLGDALQEPSEAPGRSLGVPSGFLGAAFGAPFRSFWNLGGLFIWGRLGVIQSNLGLILG